MPRFYWSESQVEFYLFMHFNFASTVLENEKSVRDCWSPLHLLCSYAVLSIESKDEQSQAQILSAALEVSFPAYCIQPLQFPEKSHLLHFLNLQIVEDDTQDFDSKYRALVAIGSLVSFFNIPLLQHFMRVNFLASIISSNFSCFGMCCP